MIYVILLLFLMISRIPITGFQFLLLLCLIETETGFMIGDYYCGTILFFYLLWKYQWWKALNAPVVQSG